ncbi:MAG: hypothetical protein DRP70_04425 [Spirochaetes bacterium]|nr:MAG: hypothetical protein DRP70_04425 [Spirochaetota bacterium]
MLSRRSFGNELVHSAHFAWESNKWPVGNYFHYLHHRYVSCNFGRGTIPWDKWLGLFYDGEGVYKAKGK